MTLYRINQEIQAAIDAIFAGADEETGEVAQEAVELLEALQIAKTEKLENIGCYIKNLNADIDALDNEIDALEERRKAKENKVKFLKRLVSNELAGKKFETPRVLFSFRSSKQTVIDDETILPKKFIVKKIELKPDKKAIKEAIESGAKVRGAHIETVNNIQVK